MDENFSMPPLGLRPRYIVAAHRRVEILEAMHRYETDQNPRVIPQEWMDELNELVTYERDRKAKDLPPISEMLRNFRGEA